MTVKFTKTPNSFCACSRLPPHDLVEMNQRNDPEPSKRTENTQWYHSEHKSRTESLRHEKAERRKHQKKKHEEKGKLLINSAKELFEMNETEH